MWCFTSISCLETLYLREGWQDIMSNPESKICPYCDEEIKEIAVKCRYCKSLLVDEIGNKNIEFVQGNKNNDSNIKSSSKKRTKTHKGWFILAGILIVLVFIVSVVASDSNRGSSSNDLSKDSLTNKMRGNTTGNIVNKGSAVIYNGWIYFGNDDSNLYKVHNDEERVEIVTNTDEYMSNLNIVDEWVYYSDIDGISKVRTDGSGRERVLNKEKT